MGFDQLANIKVIGVGGGGGNAVNHLVEQKIRGVDTYIVNTDMQALNTSIVEKKIAIGTLGAGANPEVGKKAAMEHTDKIKKIITGADMVFVVAGMGGGTGTGAAPIIAKESKDKGILTIGVVTRPFMFEGARRSKQAKEGIAEFRKYVDALIIVSNDQLLKAAGNIPLHDAFKFSDRVLQNSVQTITDLIAVPALINLDFADVRATLKGAGDALIGIGRATGNNRAIEAAQKALQSPLLEAKIKGARKAIVNITGSENLTLEDANKVVEYIKQQAGADIDIIFGIAVGENMKDNIMVTVIATGFGPVKETEKVVETKAVEEPKTDAIFSFAKPKPVVKEEPVIIQPSQPVQAPQPAYVDNSTPDILRNQNIPLKEQLMERRSTVYQPKVDLEPEPIEEMRPVIRRKRVEIAENKGVSVTKKKFGFLDTLSKFIMEEAD